LLTKKELMIKYPVLLTNTKKKMPKKLDIITATDVKNIVQTTFFDSLEFTDENVSQIYERGIAIIKETINSLIQKRNQTIGRDLKYNINFAFGEEEIRYQVIIEYLVFPNITNSVSLFIKKKLINSSIAVEQEIKLPTGTHKFLFRPSGMGIDFSNTNNSVTSWDHSSVISWNHKREIIDKQEVKDKQDHLFDAILEITKFYRAKVSTELFLPSGLVRGAASRLESSKKHPKNMFGDAS